MIVNELVTKFSFSTGNSFKLIDNNLRNTLKVTINTSARMKKAQEDALAAGVKAHERASQRIKQIQEKRLQESIKLMAAERKKAEEFMKSRVGGGGMGMLGVGVGALGLGGVGKAGFDALGEYQTGLNRLRVEYQSTTKAAAVYNDLVKFAAKTPFELPEVVDFYAQMQAQGFNLTYADLTALGDLASASNKNLSMLANTMLSLKRGHADMVDNFLGLGASISDGFVSAEMEVKGVGKVLKEFDKSDIGAIKDFFVNAGKRKNVMGMMDEQSKTIPGQLSTMRDEAKMLLVAGFKPLEGTISKAFKELSKFTTQMKPLAIETGLFIKNNLPLVFKAIGDNLPIINTGLAIMASRFAGLKIMAMADWAAKTAKAFSALGASAYFAQGGLGVFPTLLGGITIALTAVIADFVLFFNTGDSMLLKLTERWKGLHDWLKNAYEMNRIFWFAVQIGVERIANAVNQKLGPAFSDWFSGAKTIVTWMIDNLSIVKKIVDAIGGAFAEGGMVERLAGWVMQFEDRGGAGGGGGAGGAVNRTGASTFNVGGRQIVKNDAVVNSMLAVAPSIRKVRNLCLQAVWDMQQAALKGTSKITAGAAYLAADQLALDKRFTEIKLTPEMYKRMMAGDKQLQELMHGATVIYNRQSGFSPVSGHGEVWDTKNKKAWYGKGATSMVRSDQMINNARFFIPTQQSAPAPVTINQTFNGPANPAQVRQAAQQGTQQAVGRNQPRRTAPAGGR